MLQRLPSTYSQGNADSTLQRKPADIGKMGGFHFNDKIIRDVVVQTGLLLHISAKVKSGREGLKEQA